jgi:threonine synthase
MAVLLQRTRVRAIRHVVSPDFACESCAATTPALAPSGWRCACGGPWSLPPGPPFDRESIDPGGSGVWRYRQQIRLPGEAPEPTLGEGAGGWRRLSDGPIAALAHLEPTASFKARGAAVLAAWAGLAASPPLIEDSSGNAGGALAAYAAAAGLACRVYVPASAPAAKKDFLRAAGAELVEVEGPRPRATEAAIADAGGTYCSHAWNPMFLEGTKTLAFQWWEEHGDRPPPRVYVPAGQGSLVLGLRQGFGELAAARPRFRAPAIIAVQHRTAVSLWAASGAPGPSPPPRHDDLPSIADGIAIPAPVRQASVVDAIRGSGGRVIVIGNEEILAAQQRLLADGLWVEPTGAVALAGHMAAGDGADALVVLSGHGVKPAAL